MNVRHKDIVVCQEEPFANCKLGRKEYAEVLSDIIKIDNGGFVLAINSQWGTGKTTFVKMWKQDLSNKGYKTLYFNAWENDLLTDPTVAILGELKKLLKPSDSDDSKFKKILSKSPTILKKVGPSLIKTFFAKYIDVDNINSIITGTLEATSDILAEEIEEYSKKEKGINDFKKHLNEYVKEESSDKPVIFIIDELDRCRPSYAVEILERIKHFFSVEGIVFVLSIDKKQLCSSIKGFYGSENIDAEEYLRRFIDIEYRLPEPATNDFCEYLYSYFGFDEFFNDKERMLITQNQSEHENFINFASTLFEDSKLSLRQMEKLFVHSRIALKSFNIIQEIKPPFFFFLVYLRNHKEDIYNKIVSKKYNINELVSALESIIKVTNANEWSTEDFLIIQFVVYYNSYIRKSNSQERILISKENRKLLFQTKIEYKMAEQYYSNATINKIEEFLAQLIKKIELHSNFVIKNTL